MNPTANETSHKLLLKNALLALDEMQAKLDAATHARHAPIAIVGMGCRFPGGANDPELYWQLLLNGVDAVREVPPERWSREQFAEPDLPATWYGGFLDGMDQFDPQFFGISPREAATMDPQQRLVLEVGWEALESAGQAPNQLVGSQTGVFLGVTTNDYGFLLRQTGTAQLNAYSATGSALNAVAGRLAFILGLQGPTLVVDTACSSSLVAVHLACQSLRNGECDMALTGGVNLALSPEGFICSARWGMLAPDGRCKTFDAAADGFVRGEGCGIIVLKRLDDALAQNDNILAVIRGSAVNQDGRSSGLTVPNGPAQQAVLRKALADAGVQPAQISYVEAHGTGTALGDPIEVEALGAVLGEGRTQPLVMGSVKTNLGHLESAAGVAGLIKLVLSLQHETIPPHLHFHTPNPTIPWPDFPIEIPAQPRPWRRGPLARLAGISGFGFSGTNAHLIVEEAPLPEPATTEVERPLHLLTLSAPNATALAALAARFAQHAGLHPEQLLADVCYTSHVGRAHFAHRLAVTAGDVATLQVRLEAAAAGRRVKGVQTGSVGRGERVRPAWLFSGHGGQYAGMGRELYASEPVFRRAFDRCDELFRTWLSQSLVDVVGLVADKHDAGMDAGGSSGAWMESMTYSQPALFALQVALAELWRSWGVEPGAVLGHSLGQYAAAYVAGVFSLADGVKLVAARSRLMDELPASGMMVAVFASEEQVRAAIAPYAEQVSLAVYNGAQHHVISGGSEAVESVVHELAAHKIETRRLVVGQASHSPLMAPILEEFERVAAGIQLHRPQLRLISNVSGAEAGEEIATAAYWRNHLAQPVRFADSMDALAAMGFRCFLEIGPQPMLLGIGRRCLPEDGLTWLASMRAGRDEMGALLDSAGSLYAHGFNIDWAGFEHDFGQRRKVVLPTYPFQRQRYWLETGPQLGQRQRSAAVRPLIDKLTRLPLHGETVFEAAFSVETLPFLADHRVYGAIVSPGACQVAMALNAAELIIGKQMALKLEDVVLPQALVIPAEQARTVQAVFSARDGSNKQEFKVVSFASLPDVMDGDDVAGGDVDVSTHATGYVIGAKGQPSPAVDIAALQERCTQTVDIAAFYASSIAAQIELGPAFHWLAQVWRCDEGAAPEALARLVRPEAVANLAGYALHPGLLDACFQVVGFTGEMNGETMLAFAFASLHLHQPAQGENWWCHVERTGSHTCNIQLLDEQGKVVASLHDFQVRAAPASAIRGQDIWQQWLYTPAWQPLALAQVEDAAREHTGETWLVLADQEGIGSALAAQLRSEGDRVVVVSAGESWSQADQDTFRIAAENADDYRRLVAGLAAISGVVHLWSLPSELWQSGQNNGGADLLQAMRPSCESALLLVQALAETMVTLRGLWLVTQDAQAAAARDSVSGLAQAELWGLSKVVALEHPGLNPICIDLARTSSLVANPEVDAALLRAEITAPMPTPAERQIALRPDGRYVSRLKRYKADQCRADQGLTIPDEPWRLDVTTRGLLDNLELQTVERRAPAHGEVEIAVQAAGLNFRDVLNVLGAYPGDPGPVGGECAGVVVAVGEGVDQFAIGDSVITMVAGSFSQYVTVHTNYVAHKPPMLGAVEAAAIPTAFLTAYYGLHRLAQIKAGDRVLIHAAAGGVGMAAVQLAQQAGAEVFATASPSKWESLRSMGVTHLYNSRTIDFAAQILADTGGSGVDIILNSLTGPGFMEANLTALATGGYLAEMSKRNIWSQEQVADVRPDVRYMAFDLGESVAQRPQIWHEMLAVIFAFLTDEHLKPLPCTVFALSEAVDAFRMMQQARHVGKIVLTMPEVSQDAGMALTLRDKGTYLITGGLGGLGLAVAAGLVANGARHLLLTGRSQPKADSQLQLEALAEQGATVTVVQADVSDKQALQTILQEIDPALPLRGVIHAAGVLDDGVLLQQNWERFTRVFAPKVQGAWNLHQLTEGMALDFFVLFSSASSLLGNRGQSNYVAANSFLDALAHHRQSRGLPALSINWGAWAEVGLAAAMVKTQGAQLAAQGIGTIAPAQGVAAFLHLLGGKAAQAGVVPINWPAFMANAGQSDAFYDQFRMASPAAAPHESHATLHSIRQQIALAESDSERSDLLRTYLAQQVAQILRVPVVDLDPDEALTFMGLDSLMALELRNRIDSGLQLSVPVPQLLQGASINDLQVLLLAKLKEAQTSEPLPAPPALAEGVHLHSEQDATAVLAQLDDMSEENVDRLLAQLLAEEGIGG